MQPDEYETMFRVEETHWWYNALHRLIFRTLHDELPDWTEKEILDAGCGTGAILKKLGNPHRNIGIDMAPTAISFCHQRGLDNVRQADIGALPFTDASFDAIICSSVLYHEWVNDLPIAMAEMHRVLRPRGLLLINVPAFQFLHSPHDEAVMTARRFRKPELRELLKAQGFTISRLFYWTSLLFPVALAARTFAGSKTGRDFESDKISFVQRILATIMGFELRLLRRISFPVGVALFAIARK